MPFIKFASVGLMLLFSIQVMAQNRFWVGTGTQNWNNTANWSTTSGGAGGASVPGAGATAIFDANGSGTCNLDIAPTVGTLNINGFTGSLNLNGNSISVTAAGTFATGSVINTGAAASLLPSATGTITFSGTTFDVPVNGTAGRIFFNGGTFQQSVTLTKTVGTQDAGSGGVIFASTVQLTNNSTANLQLGNTAADSFQGNVTLIINSTGDISLARTSVGNTIDGQVSVQYNDLGDVWFGEAGGSTTLSAGNTIAVSGVGASGAGDLNLGGVTTSEPLLITLSGNSTAQLTLGPGSTFSGGVTADVPVLIFNTSTFSGTCTFTTNSDTNTSNCRGGNVFQGTTTFTNNGDADLVFGAIAGDAGDIYNGDCTFNDLGGGRIRVGEETAGNIFNGNATFNSNGAIDAANRIQISRLAGASVTFNGTTTLNNIGNSSDIHVSFDAGTLTTFNGPLVINSATHTSAGEFHFANYGDVVINGNMTITSTSGDNLQFGTSNGGTVTFGNGTIALGGGGFSLGTLTLNFFTKTGTAATNLALTGTSRFVIANNSVINGDFTISAPRLSLNGATFNGTSSFTKNGATSDASSGGNIFNGPAILQLTTDLANLLMANSAPDIFNSTLQVINTNTNTIHLAYNVAGNQFNDDVTLTSTAGGGIYFSNTTTGFSTLGTGASLAVSGSFIGELRLYRLTQVGSSPQDLTLTGAGSLLRVGPGSSFDGAVNFVSPRILINTSTFNSTATLEKSGATDDASGGGNVFQGATILRNSGSGYFMMGNGTNDIFNSTLTVSNTGSSIIYLGHNSTGNEFNGNITLESTGTSTGIYFSNSGGSSILASGTTLAIGPAGFSSGELRFYRFTQTGATSQSLVLTGTSILRMGFTTTFNGPVDFSAPQVFLSGVTCQSDATFTKTGGTDNYGTGPNVYFGTTTLNHAGSGLFLSATTSGDTYNGDLYLNNTGTGSIYMAHSAPSSFNGNIIVTSTSGNGIFFANNAAATATLASGKTISIGAGGFSSGRLSLIRFVQLGATSQTLALTGGSNLVLGVGNSFDGAIDFRAPEVFLDGGTYNGSFYLEKTGAVDNGGNGGAIIGGPATIVNSGSGYFRFSGGLTFNSSVEYIASGSGYLLPELVTGSTYNGNVTLTNTGSSYVRFGYTGTTNVTGNITVNSTNGIGVYIGENVGAVVNVTGSFLVGASGFSAGDLRIHRTNQTLNVPQALTLTSAAVFRIGPSTSFTGAVNFIAPRIVLGGVTFNNTTYLEKNGATNDSGAGPNTFNGVTTIVNSGSGQFISGNGSIDQFNNDVTFTNIGSSAIYVANNASGNAFLGNITVNNTGLGVFIGNGTSAASTLAAGKTIAVGGTGFTTGTLQLGRLTQLGSTAQTLNLSGSALIQIGPSTTFNGDVDFRAPRILLSTGSTFNATTYLEKNGSGDDDGGGSLTFGGDATFVNNGSGIFRSAGGNLFQGNTTISNGGSNYTLLELTAGSTYNGNLTLVNTGTSNIRAGYSGTTTINGNLILSCTNGIGIYFAETATAVVNLNGGISLGAGGFTTGQLRLQRVNQLANVIQTNTFTGSASLAIGPSSTFAGSITFTAPRLVVASSTFNNTTFLHKSGTQDDASGGGNVFQGTTTLQLSGSGYFMMGNGSADIFNGDLTVNNFGTSLIYLAQASAGNQFNGNITLNATSGPGIYFCDAAAGSATQAAGKNISIGGSGWSSGELRIKRFTSGATSTMTLLLTGATSILRVGPSTTFNNDVNFTAPRVFLDGALYPSTTYIEMTDGTGTTTTGAGGNTFNGITTLVHSGNGEFRLANTNPDIFNGDLKLFNTGTSALLLAYNATNTQFNGNVEVSSTNGLGIYFGENNGTSTLASGKTMSVGTSGFSTGELRLRRLTQTGSTAQSMTLTGTALFRFGPTLVYNANVNFIAPQVLLQGATFNGTVYIEKNGSQNNDSAGPNIYNGTTTLVNSGTGRMRLSSAADTYNGPVTFVQSSSGTLAPAYDGTNLFASDITVQSSTAITLGSGSGIVQLSGTGTQNILSTGTASPVITRLTLAKTSGSAILGTPLTVATSGTFTSGSLTTTTTNLLNFADNATASGASNASFVDGPVRKTGNDAFTFPVGKAGFYRPISISAPGNTAHHFTAEYFKSSQAFGNSVAAGLDHVSACEYWILDRTNGASNVSVTLSWQEASCAPGDVVSLAELRVARWSGTQWINHGNGGTTGGTTNGTVVSSAAITSFSPFTLGTSTGINPLPVQLIEFNAAWTVEGARLTWQTAMEINNDYFELLRSEDGINFEPINRVASAGNNRLNTQYEYIDLPQGYADKWYYKLVQTDLDGTRTDLGLRLVFTSDGIVTTYPNPSTGSFHLTGNFHEYKTWKLVDATGIDRKSGNLGQGNLITADDLPAGVYSLILQGEVRRTVLRVILTE